MVMTTQSQLSTEVSRLFNAADHDNQTTDIRSIQTTINQLPGQMAISINKVKRAAQVAYRNNVWTNGLMTNPPVITTSSSSAISGNHHNYSIVNSAGTGVATGYPFDFCGGYPYFNTGNGQVVGPSVTVPNSTTGGNIDNTGRWGIAYRAGFMTDAQTVCFAVLGYSTTYRFLVDEGFGLKYISLVPTASPSSGGTQWINLQFSSTAPAGRIIYIEMAAAGGFNAVQVNSQSTVWKIPSGNRPKIGVIGDSISIATGATFQGNGFSRVMGDCLGAPDTWMMGIGGSGYTSQATTAYSSRTSDWLVTSTNWDLLIFTGGNNDLNVANSLMQSSITSLLTLTRTTLPNVPIVVLGPDSCSGNQNPTLVSLEAAMSSAVVALNNPTIQFQPLVVYAESANSNSDTQGEMSGSGNVSAPTGVGNADIYISSDGTHPTDAGHLYKGFNRAQRVRAALDLMGAL